MSTSTSAVWTHIAADDLQDIRESVEAGRARWDDDDVLLRILWDMAAGLVGLVQELNAEHREAIGAWTAGRNSRVADAVGHRHVP